MTDTADAPTVTMVPVMVVAMMMVAVIVPLARTSPRCLVGRQPIMLAAFAIATRRHPVMRIVGWVIAARLIAIGIGVRASVAICDVVIARIIDPVPDRPGLTPAGRSMVAMKTASLGRLRQREHDSGKYRQGGDH